VFPSYLEVRVPREKAMPRSDGDEEEEWIRAGCYLTESYCTSLRPRPRLSCRTMAEEGSESNPFRYMRFLNRCAEGRCLWYPTTSGTIGDVGYVHQGYFNKVSDSIRLILSDWYSHVRSVVQRL